MRRTKTIAAAVVSLCLLAAACTSATKKATSSSAANNPSGSVSTQPGSTEKASHKQGGTVTIVNVQGQTWSCQFNPFNPAVYSESLGFVSEPLVFVDLLNNAAETPMLASSYTWGPAKKSIIFTIRDGVNWSDGQPFSADDVAFTFNLMKRVPATDLYSLWTGAGLQTVTATGNKVSMSFDKAAQPYFWYFADQVGIVPHHIWSTAAVAAHPDTWADPNPVGTGPFKVSPCGPNNIQYVANPGYWQPGKPYIQKIEYPGYLDNGPGNRDLASGKGQWAASSFPTSSSSTCPSPPTTCTWSPPVTNVRSSRTWIRHTRRRASSPCARAMSMAINRDKVSQIGEDGQQPPANQTGIILPTFST
jgi:peptide/nickel transport system substrate-binding protein